MPRIEKGSRIRYLPAPLQLQIRDAATGSFPTTFRTAVDNRTGNYPIFFDDIKTLDFVQYVTSTYYTNNSFNPKTNNPQLDWSAGENLILWWRFETSAQFTTVPNDGNGTAKDGFYVGTTDPNSTDIPAQNTGYFPFPYFENLQSLKLSGSELIFNTGDSFESNPLGYPFSVAAWFTIDSPGLNNPIASRGDGVDSDWVLWVENTGFVFMSFFDTTNSAYLVYRSNSAFPGLFDGNFHHIVFTFSNGTPLKRSLVIDGINRTTALFSSAGSFVSAGSLPSAIELVGFLADNVFLGTGTEFLNGKIDDFMIFKNHLLSLHEAQVLHSTFSVPTNDVKDGIDPGTNLPSGSQFFIDELKTTMPPVDGFVRKGIADYWVSFTQGQDLQPFHDHGNPAIDIPISNSFYSTGSAIETTGLGFQQPLQSKTKIEFDLTPNFEHGFGITNFTSGTSCFPMAYWNKRTRLYEGVGSGIEPVNYIGGGDPPDTSTSTMLSFFEEKAVGFGCSFAAAGGLTSQSAFLIGNPISNFGFPYHNKFSGSSDTTFNMSDHISEPFLLEKVVVYWSGSLDVKNITPFPPSNPVISTFFILNERNFAKQTPINQTIYYYSGTTPPTTNSLLIANSMSLQQNSSRDLVTWLQISTETAVPEYNSALFSYKELNVGTPDYFNTVAWTGQFQMSGTVKSPLASTQGNYTRIDDSGPVPYNGDPNFAGIDYLETWNENGRNGTGDTGRNWKNVVESPAQAGEIFVFLTPARGSGLLEFTANASYQKFNPYLLLPTDKLIFGWQVPTSLFSWNYANGTPVYNGEGPTLNFSSRGIHKVILYGSHLRVGPSGDLEEYHDTLNQLLSSDSIYEVIK